MINNLIVKIDVMSYTTVVQTPFLLNCLKELTLHGNSGMQHELRSFAQIHLEREVNAKILTATYNDRIIAWAFCSKEPSDFKFCNTHAGFDPKDGVLFEVFVHDDYRRRGVAALLFSTARSLVEGQNLCVCPWSIASENFYEKFKNETDKLI